MTVHGVESHAGLDPLAGASAIHALAEVIPHLAGLGAPERGTTVNVGLISGGTGRNVVAAQARCGIDVRITEPAEMARIDAALAALPSDPRVRLSVSGGWNRPPMVPNDPSRQLFKQAHAVAAELGLGAGGDRGRRGERRQLRLRAGPAGPRRPRRPGLRRPCPP